MQAASYSSVAGLQTGRFPHKQGPSAIPDHRRAWQLWQGSPKRKKSRGNEGSKAGACLATLFRGCSVREDLFKEDLSFPCPTGTTPHFTRDYLPPFCPGTGELYLPSLPFMRATRRRNRRGNVGMVTPGEETQRLLLSPLLNCSNQQMLNSK